MAATEKLSITLPAEMIREKVESGDYASNSEVIREALRTWQEREGRRASRLQDIRRKLAAAADDPRPSIPADEVFKDFKAHHQRTIRTRRGA